MHPPLFSWCERWDSNSSSSIWKNRAALRTIFMLAFLTCPVLYCDMMDEVSSPDAYRLFIPIKGCCAIKVSTVMTNFFPSIPSKIRTAFLCKTDKLKSALKNCLDF